MTDIKNSFAEAFIMHCPLSALTPELQDDLVKFDFYRFLTTFHSLEPVMRHLSYVFDWLKAQVCDFIIVLESNLTWIIFIFL